MVVRSCNARDICLCSIYSRNDCQLCACVFFFVCAFTPFNNAGFCLLQSVSVRFVFAFGNFSPLSCSEHLLIKYLSVTMKLKNIPVSLGMIDLCLDPYYLLSVAITTKKQCLEDTGILIIVKRALLVPGMSMFHSEVRLIDILEGLSQLSRYGCVIDGQPIM